MQKLNSQQLLLQASVLHDHSEIILKCWFVAQKNMPYYYQIQFWLLCLIFFKIFLNNIIFTVSFDWSNPC